VKLPGNPFRFFFNRESGDKYGRLDGFLREFFGDLPDKELKQKSPGSGVVITRQ
jgi:serine protease Do